VEPLIRMLSRSVYLARLRRAFLLRVHPDQFRTRSVDIRVGQAALVKALAGRMAQTDFNAWQQQQQHSNDFSKGCSTNEEKQSHKNNSSSFSYVLEKRNGSLVRASISLDTSVDSILASMVAALKLTGIKNLPKLPKTIDEGRFFFGGQQQSTPTQNNMVDRRYDVMSQRGRDLDQFLRELDSTSIQERKASRTDAQAVAQAVRRLYQFQAVDATTLGWSSASVAVLLRQLLALKEEHAANFPVASFYPIRLVFSKDEFHSSLDTHGGLLRLSPASTPIQWLQKLQLVTGERLEEIRLYSNLMLEQTRILQKYLGIKFKKGYSCSNQDFYLFLEQLSERTIGDRGDTSIFAKETSSSAVAIEPIVVVVEAAQMCRKAFATTQGTIRVGAGMDLVEVRHAIERHVHVARELSEKHDQDLKRCRVAIQQAQWQLGLQEVHRTGVVSHDEFLDCMERLLDVSSTATELKNGLGGKSLRIAGAGHFCHLADDGSLVIPHNWTC
jgi:hypothetical protein